MAIGINAWDADEALEETLLTLKYFGVKEESRAGKVITIQEPVVFTLYDPTRRVLFNPMRDCNPFFHVMEFVWMMAGNQYVDFPLQFNKRFDEYANGVIIHGAYGYRWQRHFHNDQIAQTILKLQDDPTTRQCVIAMWDPNQDWGKEWKDRPCNTHIYFRVVKGALNMTVCNRSNDAVWGMCGANIVHMTMLHELIARATGLPIGLYRVMTNNLHIYERHWPLFDMPAWDERYPVGNIPLLTESSVGFETYAHFSDDAFDLVNEPDSVLTTRTQWFDEVAWPMYDIWFARKDGQEYDLDNIKDAAWRKAAEEWISRRSKSIAEGVTPQDSTLS